MAINRVENKMENNFLFILKELRFLKEPQKYLKMLNSIFAQLLIKSKIKPFNT
tara:strand:- start:271 stop:429 length:159 start_codon:yes stop_codon:yes gene_type:complete